MVTTTVDTLTVEIKDTIDGYRVPETTHVQHKDKVTFMNSTGDDVSIQFSNNGVFNRSNLKLKDKGEKQLIVQENAEEKSHPYSAYCHGRGEFAEGGSMPIIIVDPKG